MFQFQNSSLPTFFHFVYLSGTHFSLLPVFYLLFLLLRNLVVQFLLFISNRTYLFFFFNFRWQIICSILFVCTTKFIFSFFRWYILRHFIIFCTYFFNKLWFGWYSFGFTHFFVPTFSVYCDFGGTVSTSYIFSYLLFFILLFWVVILLRKSRVATLNAIFFITIT